LTYKGAKDIKWRLLSAQKQEHRLLEIVIVMGWKFARVNTILAGIKNKGPINAKLLRAQALYFHSVAES